MGLNDLINDGKPEARSAFELRLKRFEDFFHHLWAHARAGVGKTELPLVFQFINADGQGATLFHGADRVLAEVPEDLLHSVSIGKNVGFLSRIAPLDFDASG